MGAVRPEGQWVGRPWLATSLRVLIIGVPVLIGSAVARLASGLVHQWGSRWVQVGVVLVVAVVASVLVSRLTSRLLPLAVLLRMTMIFPDRAPSRLKVARRTTGMKDIQTRMKSLSLDEQDAATTMLALVTALGRHDRHTRGHSERVRLFCDLLSDQLGLSPADAGRLRWAALIHDIGKLQVPAVVLNKPGQLNAREWDLIREHPEAGADLAAPLRDWLGPWFAGIAEHHEKYDGTGYPRGLSATAISPAGRAIAVVDAFETMTASRSYKAARSTLAARAELTDCAGSHFDPVIVRAFLAISLPKLLWSVGPLAFLVNLPYLGWVGQGSLRLTSAVGASASAANVAGVTAVAVAVGVTPTAAAATPAAPAISAPSHIVRGTTSPVLDRDPTTTPTHGSAHGPGQHPPKKPTPPRHPDPKGKAKPPKPAPHPQAGPGGKAKPADKAPAPPKAKPAKQSKPPKPPKPPKLSKPSGEPLTPAQLRALLAWWHAHHHKHH